MVPPAASIPGPPPGDASPASINSINEATIFASAVGPSKDLRERNLDAAMNGNARDARVVPRDGKGGDGACRRAACVSPCPWGDHEESRATHPSWQQLLPAVKRHPELVLRRHEIWPTL